MATITKIKSGNPLNQGAATLGIQRGGVVADIISLPSQPVRQKVIGEVQNTAEGRFNDYDYYWGETVTGDFSSDFSSDFST